MRHLAIIALAMIAACSAEPGPPLVASDVFVTRPMPGMNMSAAYLSLSNHSNEAIRISNVASPQYASVQLHESTLENGVARMRAIEVLEIAAGETVTLERGGKHLMLMHPTGTSDTVSLKFMDADNLILTVDAIFEPQTH